MYDFERKYLKMFSKIIIISSGSNVKQHQHDCGYHSVSSDIRRYHHPSEKGEKEREKRQIGWKNIPVLVYHENELVQERFSFSLWS